MVDSTDRPGPRFPSDQVERVRREVQAALTRWGVGSGTTVICGGARGADLIVAEEGRALGASVVLCLAKPPHEFVRDSVTLPGSDWTERFERMQESADVRVLPDEGVHAAPDNVYERTNEWLIAEAASLAGTGGRPHAIIVWNGEEGDGPGGTRHFVQQLGFQGPDPRVAVIDPTARSYERRQDGSGRKRMLALDGGGIRGALTLAILARIEAHLRARNSDIRVLADYFDYIAGTSTGAIIAAALALGKPVEEVQDDYRRLGAEVFKKRSLPLWWRSMYGDKQLRSQLESVIGRGRTLGDSDFRSLLLMVLHNTETDSPWPLSNCTRAKYNRPERCLLEHPDRNLDLPLMELVRASAAAPVYFKPQEVRVGRAFVFQDGGITPFNNPAFLVFLMATLPEYGLGWEPGEDKLLIVSVGTGTSAAVHPGLAAKQVNLLFNARNLPSVFMNGASAGQDMLCRALGLTLAGDPVDSEFGARIGSAAAGGRNLFTYLRYNFEMNDAALEQFGIATKRQKRAARKLDAFKYVHELEEMGRSVAIDFDREFGAFL
jgi:hypothetical protein